MSTIPLPDYFLTDVFIKSSIIYQDQVRGDSFPKILFPVVNSLSRSKVAKRLKDSLFDTKTNRSGSSASRPVVNHNTTTAIVIFIIIIIVGRHRSTRRFWPMHSIKFNIQSWIKFDPIIVFVKLFHPSFCDRILYIYISRHSFRKTNSFRWFDFSFQV